MRVYWFLEKAASTARFGTRTECGVRGDWMVKTCLQSSNPVYWTRLWTCQMQLHGRLSSYIGQPIRPSSVSVQPCMAKGEWVRARARAPSWRVFPCGATWCWWCCCCRQTIWPLSPQGCHLHPASYVYEIMKAEPSLLTAIRHHAKRFEYTFQRLETFPAFLSQRMSFILHLPP
jgi:hypothetical protein